MRIIHCRLRITCRFSVIIFRWAFNNLCLPAITFCSCRSGCNYICRLTSDKLSRSCCKINRCNNISYRSRDISFCNIFITAAFIIVSVAVITGRICFCICVRIGIINNYAVVITNIFSGIIITAAATCAAISTAVSIRVRLRLR